MAKDDWHSDTITPEGFEYKYDSKTQVLDFFEHPTSRIKELRFHRVGKQDLIFTMCHDLIDYEGISTDGKDV